MCLLWLSFCQCAACGEVCMYAHTFNTTQKSNRKRKPCVQQKYLLRSRRGGLNSGAGSPRERLVSTGRQRTPTVWVCIPAGAAHAAPDSTRGFTDFDSPKDCEYRVTSQQQKAQKSGILRGCMILATEPTRQTDRTHTELSARPA